MKTAVDTSVLLDVLAADPVFGETSRQALRRAFDAGALVACDVVWAEVRANFPTEDVFARTMDAIGVRFDPMGEAAAQLAGRMWRESRRISRAKGAGGNRVVADFLVGAHALQQAAVLLARDRGYYRGHFRGLRVIDPSEAP
jgi:predicted nucleic acid-binding protein